MILGGRDSPYINIAQKGQSSTDSFEQPMWLNFREHRLGRAVKIRMEMICGEIHHRSNLDFILKAVCFLSRMT